MKKALVICAVGIALLVSGCQKAGEAAVNAALAKDGVQVNTDGNSGTVTTKDGSLTFTTGDGAKLPAGFPSDVPLYPGAKLTTSMTLPNGMSVALESTDDLAKVAAFYKTSQVKAGWKLEAEINGGDSALLTFSHDKNTLQVTVGTASGKTELVLMYAPADS